MIKIKMFSDFIWPYCYVGKGIVESLSKEFDIEIEHIGFELNPQTPQEGLNFLKQFPGADQKLNDIQNLGKAHGIEFGRIEQIANTRKAHIVSEYAKEIGKGEVFVNAVLIACLVDTKNIGLEENLIEIADSVGISKEEVSRALTDTKYSHNFEENKNLIHKFSVRSAPTFVINDEHVVVGAQSRERFYKLFEKLQG